MLLTALGGKILQMRKKIVKKGGSYPCVPVISTVREHYCSSSPISPYGHGHIKPQIFSKKYIYRGHFLTNFAEIYDYSSEKF